MKFKNYILSILLFSCISLCGQQVYTITDQQSVSVKGESTLHDWKVSVSDISGLPESIDISNTLPAFTFTAAVSSMDGGRGASMNEKIQDALKNEEYPSITYTQNGVAEITTDNDTLSIASKGMIKIAGIEKEITLTMKGHYNPNEITLMGSFPFKMSEFDIDPPTAMFGQIETKDEISVEVEITYMANQ